ncbi:prepilin peptidase [Providencia manganoxydans]|uniref:prepilin peptidase n=1 Tax=Providencia manganoxydans TaxID=2923283 RepID=UPI0029C03603|nr:A24 family peptidase [Providencia manganoxydans]MDX4945410.1 A24 family peptidase [Providencia manganoxydans]
MLFSVERIYHKITNNLSLLPFHYTDGIISSTLSALTLCRGNFCLENINGKCFFGLFENSCYDRLLLMIILIFLSAKNTQWWLQYIPVKYFHKERINIKTIWLVLLYLPLIFINTLLNNELIIIALFTFFLNIMVCLFIIDLKTGYLPDILVYPLLWAGLVYQSCITQGNVVSAVYAVVISYLSIMLITMIMEKIRQRPQMGRGDLKLIAAGAAWIGLMDLPYFLALAAVLGTIHYCIAYHIKKHNNVLHAIPFGPAITLSASYWLFAPSLNPFIIKIMG